MLCSNTRQDIYIIYANISLYRQRATRHATRSEKRARFSRLFAVTAATNSNGTRRTTNVHTYSIRQTLRQARCTLGTMPTCGAPMRASFKCRECIRHVPIRYSYYLVRISSASLSFISCRRGATRCARWEMLIAAARRWFRQQPTHTHTHIHRHIRACTSHAADDFIMDVCLCWNVNADAGEFEMHFIMLVGWCFDEYEHMYTHKKHKCEKLVFWNSVLKMWYANGISIATICDTVIYNEIIHAPYISSVKFMATRQQNKIAFALDVFSPDRRSPASSSFRAIIDRNKMFS